MDSNQRIFDIAILAQRKMNMNGLQESLSYYKNIVPMVKPYSDVNGLIGRKKKLVKYRQG